MTDKPAGVDHVLQAIDHCLADWDVSPDAMRWTPASSGAEISSTAMIDQAHSFGAAAAVLRPYLLTIGEHIRLLTATCEIPPLFVRLQEVLDDGTP